MADEQTVDQATQTLGEENVETTATTEQSGETTFTQEQVNGIASKEAKKAQEKLLRDLGVEDFESAKDGLAKFKEYQDAQKTDVERQQEALALAKERESKLSEDISAKEKEITSLNAKITALGLGVNNESIDDVIALAERNVNEEVTIEDAIKSVIDKYPHFQTTQQASTQATKTGNPNGSRVKESADIMDDILANYK